MKKFNKLLSLIMTVIMLSSLFVFSNAPSFTTAAYAMPEYVAPTPFFVEDGNADNTYEEAYRSGTATLTLTREGGATTFTNTGSGEFILSTPSVTSSNKYYIEYEVSSLPNGKYFQVFPGGYYYAPAVRQTGKYYGVYNGSSYKVYKEDGAVLYEVTSTNATPPKTSDMIGINFNVGVKFNYIVAYPMSEYMSVKITESDASGVTFKTTVPIVTSSSVAKVGETELTISTVSGELCTYKAEFETGFADTITENEIVLTLNSFEGTQIESINNAKFKIPMDIELSLEGGALRAGTNVMVADINNEKTPESAVLVGVVYHSDGKAEIFPFDITTATATGEDSLKKEFSVETVEDDAVFEMYIVDSLDTMNFKTAKKVYDKNGEIVYSDNILPEDGTTVSLTVSDPDPEKGTAKFTLTLNEGKSDSAVYIKILDDENKIVYLKADNTENSKADFTVKFPESTEPETYKVYWGYTADTENLSCSYDYLHYSKTYIDNCASIINTATVQDVTNTPYTNEQIAALTDLCTVYRYNLAYSEAELQQLFRCMVGLRIEKEGFADSKAILDALKEAEMLIIEKNNNAEQFITDFNEKYGFDTNAYKLFNETFSEIMRTNAVGAFDAVQPYNIEETKNLFVDSVAKKGIEYSSNYMQVRGILDGIGSLIDLVDADLTLYNGFDTDKKEIVENGLVGYSGNDLPGEFSRLVGVANTPTPSEEEDYDYGNGSSGGGGGGGKKTSGALTGLPVVKSEETPISPSDNKKEYFDDLSGYDWAKEAINSLAEKNIISGTGNNKYNPENNITRREIAKIIATAYELKAENDVTGFTDVESNDWASSYIAAVFSSGIMNGIENKSFAPQNFVSREMFATIIYRALKNQGISLESNTVEFSDKTQISDYALEAVAALTKAKVINGIGNNSFAPKQNLSRAEAAVMIYRALSIK